MSPDCGPRSTRHSIKSGTAPNRSSTRTMLTGRRVVRRCEPTITTTPTLRRPTASSHLHPQLTDKAGRILLIKRRDNKLWALPGGGHDVGETIEQTAVREVKEETGLGVEVTALTGIYTDPAHIVAFSNGDVRQQFSRQQQADLRISVEQIVIDDLEAYLDSRPERSG
jgi:8-oxo-dGTP pyrophosphatase MutT (NUDIX family)